MKIKVEFSDAEIKDICRISGETRKGPAIRKLVVEALMLRRREPLVEKFVSGEWGVELKGFEKAGDADRRAESQRGCGHF